jgi:hypothetical protein
VKGRRDGTQAKFGSYAMELDFVDDDDGMGRPARIHRTLENEYEYEICHLCLCL